MSNTTDEYWDVNGTSLQTYAHNLSTWGGSKQGAPKLRGDDLVIPGRPGRTRMPKTPDSRTLEFSGWLLGTDDDGIPYDTDMVKRNWRTLRGLFVDGDRIVTMTRRWRDTAGGTVRSASATGQVLDEVAPDMSGPGRSEFLFPVFLADPFLYGAEVDVALPAGTTAVTVPGDYTTYAVSVLFTGPLTSPAVADSVSGRSVGITGDVASGHVVTVDVTEYDVLDNGVNALGRLAVPSGPPWFPLAPAAHVLTRTGTGTGSVLLKYRPVYY